MRLEEDETKVSNGLAPPGTKVSSKKSTQDRMGVFKALLDHITAKDMPGVWVFIIGIILFGFFVKLCIEHGYYGKLKEAMGGSNEFSGHGRVCKCHSSSSHSRCMNRIP